MRAHERTVGVQHLRVGWILRAEICRKIGHVYLLMPRDERIHDRDSDAAADVAEEVENPCRVADLLVIQRAHGNCR